jgi:hypothetical protein
MRIKRLDELQELSVIVFTGTGSKGITVEQDSGLLAIKSAFRRDVSVKISGNKRCDGDGVVE